MTNKNGEPQTDTFHIGKLIKAELRCQGRTITWLAGEVHCSRENLYKVFRHPWINTDMLIKISETMHHDFFKDCSDWLKFKRVGNNLVKKGLDVSRKSYSDYE